MYEDKLRLFVAEMRKKPEVLAIGFLGSTATGNMDKFSDLDMQIIVRDKNYKKIYSQLPKFFSIFGKLNFWEAYPQYPEEAWAFVGNDYLKVEIDVISKSKANAGYWLHDAKVIYDKDGKYTKEVLKSKKTTSYFRNLKEIRSFLLNTRSNFIYVARHYGRGQKLSAVSDLNKIGGDLFGFLAEIKRMTPYDLIRQAEKVLTKTEWKFINESKCKSKALKEVWRSIQANWKYMRYLESAYEKTNNKLDLTCNDNEILNIVKKTLAVK